MNIQIGERPSSSRTTYSYTCDMLLQVTRLQMSGYSIARYLVQSKCKYFNKLACWSLFMQRIIWMDELSFKAQFHMIISMFARHFHLYVRGTLLVVQVSGAIWVSWYLGQSQTDKNTESTATPPTTNTQWWLFCSSMLLQICQRTNKKNIHIQIVPNSKCSLLCEFLFSDLQAMKKKIGPSLFNLSA